MKIKYHMIKRIHLMKTNDYIKNKAYNKLKEPLIHQKVKPMQKHNNI